MNRVTYSLRNGDSNSNLYYRKIESLSNKIINYVLTYSSKYLEDFMDFIVTNKIEYVRTKEEYSIEVLLIGVILEEYLSYGRGFENNTSNNVFNILNTIRNNEEYKEKIDVLRGRLAFSILMKRKEESRNIDFKDLKLVVGWMKATGDFKEEIYRLVNWIDFLELNDEEYINEFLKICARMSRYLYMEAKTTLGEYTKNVEKYLSNYRRDHINKEDVFFCGKGEIQYFFNMICAEVMNTVYKDEFKLCKIKKIFLPICMRQTIKECKAKDSHNGCTCMGCSEECNVNKLSKIVEESNAKVYIIPHETMLFKDEDKNYDIGIIGIACVTNLVSGGWKALRLGFKPQCVLLDYCGCSKHWCNEPIMTAINVDRLKNILGLDNTFLM